MIRYRPLTIEDGKDFYDTALKSWLFTYKDIYSEEFIKNFIDENYSEQSIKNALDWARENNGYNYLAVDENKIVGYVTIGPVGDDWRLFRIYLLPEYIGNGIGSTLLDMGEEFIRNMGGKSYYLTVHNKNMLGKNFYDKKGFVHIPDKDQDEEWYMEKAL